MIKINKIYKIIISKIPFQKNSLTLLLSDLNYYIFKDIASPIPLITIIQVIVSIVLEIPKIPRARESFNLLIKTVAKVIGSP